jgi:hypothetical protein
MKPQKEAHPMSNLKLFLAENQSIQSFQKFIPISGRNHWNDFFHSFQSFSQIIPMDFST